MERQFPMTASKSPEVTIRLRCVEFPGRTFEGSRDVEVGVQKDEEVIDLVPGDAKEAQFMFLLRVEKNPKTGKPNFLGPFAHGTPTNRFLYLSWSAEQGAQRIRFRRAKILLNHIEWLSIEKALKSGNPIDATLRMTDKNGGPICASVKPDRIKWDIKA